MSFDWLTDEQMHQLNERKLALMSEGREVSDLTMINPDIAPPRLLIDKLLELTVRGSNHRYAVARGIRRLREALAHKYEDRFRVRVDAEREVCVTLGSKDAVEQILRVIASEHTASNAEPPTLLVGNPAYPHYRVAALLNGFRFVTAPLSESLDELLEAAAQLPRRSVLMLNFPHNPTGMLAPEGFFERVAAIAAERDLIVINDFVYGELVYGGAAAQSLLSVASLRERAIEIYSLSKAYSIPGWRIGAVFGWPAIISQLALLKSHIDYGAFLPLQGAASAALHAPQSLIAPVVDEYERRARILVSALEDAGWQAVMPDAGCAVWARLPGFTGSGYELSRELLERVSIGVVPGERFFDQSDTFTAPLSGESRVDGWVRFALVATEGTLRLIGDRIIRITPELLASATSKIKST